MKRKKNLIKLVSMMLAVGVLITSFGTASTVNAKTNWKKLYANYIEQDDWCCGAAFSATLVYINNDEIPEIYIWGRDTASGNRLLSIYKDKVYASYVDGHAEFFYVPKKGLVNESDVYMYVGAEKIGKLVKGKLKYTKCGKYVAIADVDRKYGSDVMLDSNGQPIYNYYWEDKKVSKKSFYTNVKKAKGTYKYVSTFDYCNILCMNELKETLSGQ